MNTTPQEQNKNIQSRRNFVTNLLKYGAGGIFGAGIVSQISNALTETKSGTELIEEGMDNDITQTIKIGSKEIIP